MESDIPLLILIFTLILLSGVFSGAELALFSLSPAKIRSLIENKKKGAKAVQKLRDNPHDLLITILIGNNLVNILASVLSTVWASRTFGLNALAYVTGGITFLVLVFGEIVPKTFAQKYAELFSRIIAPFILFLGLVLKPLIILFTLITKGIMKIFGVDDSPLKSFTEEELLAMVDIGTEEGELDLDEKELIENVLDFSETTAEEVMTPRPQMDALDEDSTLEEAIKYVSEHSHSRIPVYRETIDNIVGILSVRQILDFWDKKSENTQLKDLNLGEPFIVPKSKLISNLFKDFKIKRTHLAIIVDEHGGVAGLVSLEDILEEIVGDIVDESDIEEVLIKKTGTHTWILSGDAIIEDINKEIGLELNAPEHKNISYLILEENKHIPKPGDIIHLKEVELLVEKISDNKIEIVRLLKKSIPND